jgi:hypothetical protein
MDLLSKFNFGVLSGWVYFSFYLIVFGTIMCFCSKEVRERLYDRFLWDKKTKRITTIGKLFFLGNIILITI